MSHLRPPKAVVFDLGKVLLDFDYGVAARNLARHCPAGPEQVAAVIDQTDLLLRYERGELTTTAFFDAVRSATGFSGLPEQFERGFAEIFEPIPEMLALHDRLRQASIPTFIFSNTNEIATRHIRARYPFFSRFDGYVLSWEHGAMKPDHRLYEVVEQRTGWSGSDLLYVDDRPENVASGTERGWRTILHSAPDRTRAAMRRHGLPVDPLSETASHRP